MTKETDAQTVSYEITLRAIGQAVERCPDTDRLSHALRMLGAHLDKSKMTLLGIQRDKGVFTIWHQGRRGDRLKEVFTQANLYDLWVHLYKQRKESRLKPTG